MPDGKPLLLLINHLKSMGYSAPSDPNSNQRRLGQAQRVAEILGAHDLTNEYIAVVGDLNANADSASLAPILSNAQLYNVNLNFPNIADRATHGTIQLDYVIVSQALKTKLQNVYIERHGVYSTKHQHYPTVTGRANEASDHAAVVADFDF